MALLEGLFRLVVSLSLAGSAATLLVLGAKAVWKDIQLLYDNGDTYIAALDQSSTSNLWPEDLILLDTQELFDGKLVK